MLEEQLREVEMKAETRLKEEQQRFKDMVVSLLETQMFG